MTAKPEPNLHKRYVDLADGQVHVHQRAGCEPALVFLHQTASSATSFDQLMACSRLPNRMVAVDAPGFGGSFDPPGRPSMSDYARWVLEACNGLGLGRVHLFGHHTGASLAIEMAAMAPERVLSLMLAGPVFMTEAERREFEAAYQKPIAPRRDGSHLLENWNYAAKFNPDCPVELLQQEVVAMLRAWRGRAQAYRAVARHDPYAGAQGLELPVLLLTSPDDFFHDSFDRAVAAFPHARVARVGGGNFQPSADPEGVARAIRDFLNQSSGAATGS
jgi:pimeloyl-ACP methyl ester carboxylesterase